MRDIQQTWKEIREIEAGLTEFVWLVPTGGGPPVEAAAPYAARFLHAKSHRPATEEELQNQRNVDDLRKQRASRDQLRRMGVAVVEIPSN
jgi:hypothetical protein